MSDFASCPRCAFYASHEGTLCPEHEFVCPGCHHPIHRMPCPKPIPRWRQWLVSLITWEWKNPLTTCSCIYWDARWDARMKEGGPDGN